MKWLKHLWTLSLEGEKGRAIVRFWKGFFASALALVLVPVANGLPLADLLPAWPQVLATALLAGVGLGSEKMIRAVQEENK